MATRIGVSGFSVDGMSAVYHAGDVGACPESRARRVRTASIRQFGWPEASLTTLLEEFDVRRPPTWITAEPAIHEAFSGGTLLDHHQAHARSSFLTSGLRDAVILICDGSATESESVWLGGPDGLQKVCLPEASTPGLAVRLKRAAGDALGGDTTVRELETMARQRSGQAAQSVLSRHVDEVIHLASGAAAIRPGLPLCVGGGLFHNGYLNTMLRTSGLFPEVYVPPNPGNGGLALGCALPEHVSPHRLSPFLGPSYDNEAVKAVLDNCKLTYRYLSDSDLLDVAVHRLMRGGIVGWFRGRMEWGQRALGHRSILASPLAVYVSQNLNSFLKHRPAHYTYALAVLDDEMRELFLNPVSSPYMEAEATLPDSAHPFGTVAGNATRLRVQTVAPSTDPFADLLARFRERQGIGALVNTSFNGFHEPIVMTPRDAVRVFFGTGLDAVAIENFWIEK